jgi:DNA-nicking Smr family endonuclease
VTPLLGRRTAPRPSLEIQVAAQNPAAPLRAVDRRDPAPRVQDTKAKGPGETLDGHWDRRLRQGSIAPERSIDLHGHTLTSAHDALDHALERAITDDVRLLLVVTGRPPRSGETKRGLIRAQIGDWLASSRHRGRIAAIRNAHPRHGGAGALYLILRRRRG